MVPAIRKQFNESFTDAGYQQYLAVLNEKYKGAIEFRVAETPVFIDKIFKEKLLSANHAIPSNVKVPNENKHTNFIAFDFGICENELGELEPQLIEMQGFPTLFAYQIWHDLTFRKQYAIPENFTCYLNGFTQETYTALLNEIIVGNYSPEEVILLELFPHEQKTKVDFYFTAEYTGISIVCLTELIKEGNDLFYITKKRNTSNRPNSF